MSSSLIRRTVFLVIAHAALIISLAPAPAFSSEKIPLMKLEEVTDLLMSPGCNYTYTLTLCPSAEAAQMREIVKDKLRNGETKEQILAYFEKIYGPRVLARPARRGFYSLAWWFPYFLLIDLFALVAVVLHVWRKRSQGRSHLPAGGPAPPEADRDDEMFEEEVRRFKGL